MAETERNEEMKGYWGPPAMGCVCCHSGPKEKFWCQPCDHVCKAPLGWKPLCPFCRAPMTNMGHRWRPGKKGKRKATGTYRQYPDQGPSWWQMPGTKLRVNGRIRSWRLP
jgi:hypothetical protein